MSLFTQIQQVGKCICDGSGFKRNYSKIKLSSIADIVIAKIK